MKMKIPKDIKGHFLAFSIAWYYFNYSTFKCLRSASVREDKFLWLSQLVYLFAKLGNQNHIVYAQTAGNCNFLSIGRPGKIS